MPAGKLHLVKLCVGVDTLDQLLGWQATAPERNAAQGLPPHIYHVTRMWPRRADDLLDGGSLYWVIKGQVQARQRIDALEERIGADGIRRCAIRLHPDLFATSPQPRRAFQGWRYLKPEDAPIDIGLANAQDDDLPLEMRKALSEIGVV